MRLTAAALQAPLFVPGDQPARFAKAAASGATAVIIDLEDAVRPDQKAAARNHTAACPSMPVPVLVRINAADTPWFADDLAMLRDLRPAAVMLPKADSRKTLAHVAEATGCPVLVPLIESVAGLAALADILSSPGVVCAAFGSIDLSADLGCAGDWEPLLMARSDLVLRSRIAGIGAPIDGVTPAVDDTDRVAADARRARALGFAGKLAIHPRQVDPIRAAFRPSAADLEWAEAVLARAETSPGAFTLGGEMIDKPIVEQARRIAEGAR